MLRPFRKRPPEPAPDPLAAVDERDRAIVERALPHTLIGVARLQATIDAVRYVVARDIEGALAECGIWRGGSVLAMLLALCDEGVTDRDVYLYDTFDGMTQPTEVDVSRWEGSALALWREAQCEGRQPFGEYFDEATHEDAVRALLADSGYPFERLHFVRGRVEDTLPAQSPERLALLRLDTDWYESTRHELVHLYPRLADGGVLIVDDYGHWQGSKRAVDEYFADRPLLLTRSDYAGRMAVKH